MREKRDIGGESTVGYLSSGDIQIVPERTIVESKGTTVDEIPEPAPEARRDPELQSFLDKNGFVDLVAGKNSGQAIESLLSKLYEFKNQGQTLLNSKGEDVCDQMLGYLYKIVSAPTTLEKINQAEVCRAFSTSTGGLKDALGNVRGILMEELVLELRQRGQAKDTDREQPKESFEQLDQKLLFAAKVLFDGSAPIKNEEFNQRIEQLNRLVAQANSEVANLSAAPPVQGVVGKNVFGVRQEVLKERLLGLTSDKRITKQITIMRYMSNGQYVVGVN